MLSGLTYAQQVPTLRERVVDGVLWAPIVALEFVFKDDLHADLFTVLLEVLSNI